MTSAPIRDPLADHLITPQNPALIVIDYRARNRSAGNRSRASYSATGRGSRPYPELSRSLFTDRLSTA